MRYIFRKIRKAKWYKHNGVTWLSEDEIQADAVGDFNTKNNSLSVWIIDEERSNLDVIIAAIGSNTDRLSNIDYVLFEMKYLDQLNIDREKTKGNSPCEKANASWHLDLVELTASKIVGLVEVAYKHGSIKRVYKPEVKGYVKEGVKEGEIDKTLLSSDIIGEL